MDETRDSNIEQREPPTLVAGTVFQQRYEIQSQLGRGGFGVVYRALQLATGQPVAIKVIQPGAELLSELPKLRARFTREMQLCAQLQHPNIVQLIDSGQTEQEMLYTVFAYVPGQNLAEALQQEGKLAPVEAGHLMGQVLDALSAAHDAEVIHRDLKPGNIMISPSGARRNALVLDFGIGVCLNPAVGDGLTQLTGTRDLLGTPSYSAPEQLRGSAPSPRSDLYSWGLVLMECLTGQRVMDGATFVDVVYKQLGPEPIPIPKMLRRHPVGELLRAVLHKEIEQRDVTAQALLRQLEACDLGSLRRAVRHSEEVGSADTIHHPVATPTTPSQTPRRGPDSDSDAYSWPTGRAERRQLTVVDCTFSQAADRPAGVDPEEFSQHLLPLCEELARRFEGHVGHVFGDRVQLYFGFPQAREDDVRRAARAALDMVRRVPLLAEPAAGPRPAVQVGVDTGVVIARRAGGPDQPTLEGAVGASPKVAAHLSAAADPGTVLVSAATRKRLRGQFTLVPAGDHAVANLGQDVTAYCLESETMSSVSLATLFDTDTSPVVGRGPELELLRSSWRRAQQGEGQATLLIGEPGIGKSRLVRELVRLVSESSGVWQEWRATPESQRSTLRPVAEMLERLMSFGRGWNQQQKMDAIEQLLGRHEMPLPANVPLLAAVLSLPPSEQYPLPELAGEVRRKLTLEALRDLLLEMSSQQPLLLVVEDLHWADPTTLELLGLLVEGIGGEQLCVTMTSRPELQLAWAPPVMARVQQIPLGRLGRDHVVQLVTDLTGLPLTDAALDEVMRRADGVALFVEELIRMLQEEDLLVEQGDHLGLRCSPEQLQGRIPATLHELLAARLDRLGQARHTAQLASAMGREFSHALLSAASPLDDGQLARDLAALTNADLVRRRRRHQRVMYTFRHALIRDMAYDSMVRSDRQDAHRSIVAAIEAGFPELVATRPELLALHHEGADQQDRALVYAARAGMIALQRSAYAAALDHANRAQPWLKAVADERQRALAELDLNGVLAPALMSTDGWGAPAIRQTVERSQQLIDQVGDAPDSAPHVMPNLVALMLYHHLLANRAQCRQLSEQMVALADQSGDTAARVVALPFLATCLMEEGDFPGACELVLMAIDLHDPAEHRLVGLRYGMDPLATSRQLMGLLLANMGQLDKALEQTLAAEAWAREVKHGASTSMAILHTALVYSIRGERGPVLEHAGRGMTLAGQQGLRPHQGYFALLLGWAMGNTQMMQPVVEALEQRDLQLGLPHHRALLAQVLAAQGNLDGALELTERSLQDSSNLSHLSVSRRLRGEYLLARDEAEADAAEQDLRAALEIGQRHHAALQELQAATSLGRLLQRSDRADEARQLLGAALKKVTQGQDTPPVVTARALLQQL